MGWDGEGWAGRGRDIDRPTEALITEDASRKAEEHKSPRQRAK